MTKEKSELLNHLIKIENELQDLWEFHPDNKDAIDVVDRFNNLQQDAATIENHLQTLWSVDDIEGII